MGCVTDAGVGLTTVPCAEAPPGVDTAVGVCCRAAWTGPIEELGSGTGVKIACTVGVNSAGGVGVGASVATEVDVGVGDAGITVKFTLIGTEFPTDGVRVIDVV